MTVQAPQTPYGGELIDLIVADDRAAELRAESRDWRSWDLTRRQLCDLELLLSGGFSPLRGFLGRADYESVRDSRRLSDGTLWPIPVCLDLPQQIAETLEPGERLVLRDPEGVMLAVLSVSDVYRPDRELEAQAMYGTTSDEHAGVRALRGGTHPVNVAGELEGVRGPTHYDFRGLRLTPAQVRHQLEQLGWSRVVAYGTRNAMHRPQQELTLRAAREAGARVLLHPIVGIPEPAEVDHYTRVRCYRALLGRYSPGAAMLALLPLATRMAGPREALWQAIVRRNHGATHMVVERDHASVVDPPAGHAPHEPGAAFEALARHADELGIEPIAARRIVYLPDRDAYAPEDETPADERTLSLSGAELAQCLERGRELPAWFTFPETARELQRACAPRARQGFTVFMTGLSGSGKSTVANALLARILELGERRATLLDGDLVRKHLSSELGFSKADRDLNVRRIGFVASEITKYGGIAICAPIAPYRSIRDEVRAMIEPHGGFLLVHVATPLEVCEQRDRKGLYAKARAGRIGLFTGISDPYETPQDADVVVDTSDVPAAKAAETVLDRLVAAGYLERDPGRL